MSTSNNIILNQEEIMDHSSTPPLPLPLVLLSFGNILNKFPEFLLQVLPYIADRIVWNSIASSSKMIYYRTKEDEESYLPPWPFNFKLRVDFYDPAGIISNPVWSPDGTQIAYATYSDWDSTYYNYIIVIYDQRRGLLRFQPIGHISENDDSDIDGFPTLRFSPDGSILVSAGNGDGLVKIWDYNITGYHLHYTVEYRSRT
ncbi:hypothetical protein FRACYDRAFT_231815 [Fragilariopsis cylindrus CCMP1102]|uniref:WD40 repeat-like protein n=1 Tax=Fragilariopsis cylindrus CCMP1102 TaxID=635003 RepID=A0A1E7FU70_9STRA|nr:hypothetical protein FRACYDRAFT_231815 [Fragilariopsis cylindrus CCMP1102]|eukprot:OEU21674.1 hypothetical protein FRACYDRAFT_231815 [Fragilariopsis cylindrus CCMP1102]